MEMWENPLHANSPVRERNSGEILSALEEHACAGTGGRRNCSSSGGGVGAAVGPDASESRSGLAFRIAHGRSATHACLCT
jgi:hypothetical protein